MLRRTDGRAWLVGGGLHSGLGGLVGDLAGQDDQAGLPKDHAPQLSGTAAYRPDGVDLAAALESEARRQLADGGRERVFTREVHLTDEGADLLVRTLARATTGILRSMPDGPRGL